MRGSGPSSSALHSGRRAQREQRGGAWQREGRGEAKTEQQSKKWGLAGRGRLIPLQALCAPACFPQLSGPT